MSCLIKPRHPMAKVKLYTPKQDRLWWRHKSNGKTVYILRDTILMNLMATNRSTVSLFSLRLLPTPSLAVLLLPPHCADHPSTLEQVEGHRKITELYLYIHVRWTKRVNNSKTANYKWIFFAKFQVSVP
jgi:hypothetical protein